MIRDISLGRLTPQQLGVQLLETINRSTPMEEIRALIEYGADLNIQDNNGWTPLHHACYNNTDLATFLIEHEADVNIQDHDGWTPLYWACFMNKTGIANLILNAGADINLSLLKAFVRYDEWGQIDEVVNNRSQEHINLHLRGDANIETIAILDMLYFPSRYDGILHLIGNDNNEIHLHFDAGAEYLLK